MWLEKRKMKWHLMNADICLCCDTEIKGGLLWWVSGEKSACSAGNRGSIPDSGGSHMPGSNYACSPQLLSLCSRAQEPQLLSSCTQLPKPMCPRAHALQPESSLNLLPLEKSPHSSKDPAQPKNIIEISKYIYIYLFIYLKDRGRKKPLIRRN